jgi:hypothetical protein
MGKTQAWNGVIKRKLKLVLGQLISLISLISIVYMFTPVHGEMCNEAFPCILLANARSGLK